MKRKIKIGEKDVQMETSAALPRIYRLEFNRDIFKDMSSLQDITEENAFDGDLMMVLEQIAYSMAKHANNDISDVDTWLRQFGTFELIDAMPEIVDLWISELYTKSISKKKTSEQQ